MSPEQIHLLMSPWGCTNCGAWLLGGLSDGAWRWTGEAFEHACTIPECPQAGHFPARRYDSVAEVLKAVRDESWREGAEAMRRDCAKMCEVLAEQESELCRALEARGDQLGAAIRRDRAVARLQVATELRALPIPPRPEVPRG